jgi:transketolase C-terminal domain/subunit
MTTAGTALFPLFPHITPMSPWIVSEASPGLAMAGKGGVQCNRKCFRSRPVWHALTNSMNRSLHDDVQILGNSPWIRYIPMDG